MQARTEYTEQDAYGSQHWQLASASADWVLCQILVCLRLTASNTEPFRVLHALDVTIRPANGQSGPLLTHLYDKRRDAQFQGVTEFKRFPAADSMLAWSCKLNVFNAQFKRFTRIITDVNDFKGEVVRLMVEMIQAHYPSQPLFHRCRRCCSITPVLFGVARGTAAPNMGQPIRGLFTDIKQQVNAELHIGHWIMRYLGTLVVTTNMLQNDYVCGRLHY